MIDIRELPQNRHSGNYNTLKGYGGTALRGGGCLGSAYSGVKNSGLVPKLRPISLVSLNGFSRSHMAMEIQGLVDVVRQTGFEIHCYFENGFMEMVYETALAHRLRKKGIRAQQQMSLPGHDDDGTQVGLYVADLWIEGSLFVKLKAVSSPENIHAAQVLSYLKAAGLRDGMSMNFGAPDFQVREFIKLPRDNREMS